MVSRKLMRRAIVSAWVNVDRYHGQSGHYMKEMMAYLFGDPVALAGRRLRGLRSRKGLPGPFVAILVFDRQQVVGAPECLPVVRRRGLLRSVV